MFKFCIFERSVGKFVSWINELPGENLYLGYCDDFRCAASSRKEKLVNCVCEKLNKLGFDCCVKILVL